jgi:uncharacterized protein YndB with AHSA1/START domain
MDVRPGGRWQATQVSSEDGTELPFAGLYREVIAPERLVLTFQDPADPDDPNAEVATITLEDVEGGTRMALEQTGHLPEEQYPLLEQGYTAFFNQMAEGLSGT